MSSGEQLIKFSIEESKSAIRSKLSQNLSNLIDLTKSSIKGSETQDLFKSCFKAFSATESLIEQSCDKFKKIEIVSNQLNFQVSQIKDDVSQIDELCRQIDSIQKRKTHYNVPNPNVFTKKHSDKQ